MEWCPRIKFSHPVLRIKKTVTSRNEKKWEKRANKKKFVDAAAVPGKSHIRHCQIKKDRV